MRVANTTYVGKNGNYIELNGRRYDAITGKMIGGMAATPSSPGKFVDGFVRPGQISAAQLTRTPAAPVSTATTAPKARPVMDIQRPGGVKIAHHAPKKSQTLMRSAVSKPEPSLKRKTKTTTHTHAIVEQPKFEIVKKLSHPKVDPKRAQRSSRIPQSEYIHRFAQQPAAPKPVVAPIAVKPVMAATPAPHAVSAPSPHASSMDVFERALQRANSHMELPPAQARRQTKRRKSLVAKRALSISTAALAVLLLSGFIAFQNQANLTVKYASTKAGFAAALPAYKPAGYSVGKFTYSPGQVGVVYTNNASGQSFSLVQKQSPWDSTALRENFVAMQHSSYKTVQSAGRTIYTYGQNNATWVNGGVWYQVNTAGSLTTEEIVNLANSI